MFIPKDMVKRRLSALRLNEFHLADPGFRRDVGSEVATLVAGGRELEESPGGSPDLSHSYVELAEGSCEAKEPSYHTPQIPLVAPVVRCRGFMFAMGIPALS